MISKFLRDKRKFDNIFKETPKRRKRETNSFFGFEEELEPDFYIGLRRAVSLDDNQFQIAFNHPVIYYEPTLNKTSQIPSYGAQKTPTSRRKKNNKRARLGVVVKRPKRKLKKNYKDEDFRSIFIENCQRVFKGLGKSLDKVKNKSKLDFNELISPNVYARESKRKLSGQSLERNRDYSKSDKKPSKKAEEVITTPLGLKGTSRVIIELQDEHQAPNSPVVKKMVRWCTICDIHLPKDATNENHLEEKKHKQKKNFYRVTNQDEKNCILNCNITELSSNRMAALKRRCKKIRQHLTINSLKHDSIALGKENYVTGNKTRLQKLSIEIDRLMTNQIKDMNAMKSCLIEIIKILDKNVENDLHILRLNRFIQVLIEIIKSVNICQKRRLDQMVIILDSCTKLLTTLCSLKQNRTYMILTNKVIPLVDLLLWAWNNASKFIYCFNFIPELFHLITFLIRHRVEPEHFEMKDKIVEYIVSCGLLIKLKQRFTSFNSGLDLTSSSGKVPLALLKAIAMLEAVTHHLEMNNQPVFERSKKLNKSVCFLLKETEISGCLQLMSGILLSGGTYKRSFNKILPQTIFSVVMLTIKVFNNVARINLNLIQEVITDSLNMEQFYHCMIFLLDYTSSNFDRGEEEEELLNETILLLGYSCYLNIKNQELMSRGHGSNTIVSKLLNLKYSYYVGNTPHKEVLFPTLISIVYQNEHNLQLIKREMNPRLLMDYLRNKKANYGKPRNITLPDGTKVEGRGFIGGPQVKNGRSMSMSSNTSSANSLRLHPSAFHNFCFENRIKEELIDQILAFLEGKDN